MSSFSDTLIGMGFAEANVRYALRKTGGGSVQAALDYMINHPDADGKDEADDAMQVDAAPKKVLTDQEKQEQKQMLLERIEKKRAEREKNEAAEALAKEKIRREEGRMTIKEKHEHQERETKKMLDQRKRERAEDAEAKRRIKEQLLADKARRLAQSQKKTEAPAPAPAQPKPQAVKKDYGDCAVRFRLATGEQLTGKFKPTDTLSTCLTWLKHNRKDRNEDGTTAELTDPLTRRTFTHDDGEKTMSELGWVPRVALQVKNSPRVQQVHAPGPFPGGPVGHDMYSSDEEESD